MDSASPILIDALRSGPLVLDGATGTGLMALRPDVDPAQGLERLCSDDPAVVSYLHTEHLRAGCDLVRTNTFCGSAPELDAVGLGGRARELARAAAQLARDAVDAERTADRRAFVLGVIGPGAARLLAADCETELLSEAERERALGLVEGGIDAFLIETVGNLRHLRAAVSAAREAAPDLPIIAGFTVGSDGCLASGASMSTVAIAATKLNLDATGLNCSQGPASLDGPLEELRRAWVGPLGAWPNAGLPVERNGKSTWPIGPDELAEWLTKATRDRDLRIVGGCCGTTTAHVEAIARAHLR